VGEAVQKLMEHMMPLLPASLKQDPNEFRQQSCCRALHSLKPSGGA
jgi:hypothetical protein